jgi:hypothetical protein
MKKSVCLSPFHIFYRPLEANTHFGNNISTLSEMQWVETDLEHPQVNML